MANTIASGNTTFVPHFDATNKMQFEFSRDPSAFALPNYAAMRKVNLSEGLYMKAENEQASRVVDPNLHKWVDGADGMPDNEGQVPFQFLAYRTEREKFDLTLGYKAIEQAAFDVVPLNSRAAAQRAMTARTIDAQAALAAASWGSNTATATVASGTGGGKWDVSTAANQFILKSFGYAKQVIFKSTQGAVRPKALTCVVSPGCALLMRGAPEIVDFIKQQASAPAIMSQESDAEFFQMWGLPRYLYGVKMVVEDAVRTSTSKGGAGTKGYAEADTVAYFLTNTVDAKKDVDLPPGQGSILYDTLTQFMYEEMTVETLDDPNNRRKIIRCVNDYDSVVTCPESGFYMTAVTG
jgi:hypothetical protein